MNDEVKKSPFKISLEKGKQYFWCTCGYSDRSPFCDGSHKGKGYSPLVFEVNDSKDYYLCGCGDTENKPFCDGSHKK